MSEWRIIRLSVFSPQMNMAIDEAMLNARIRGFIPNTLRVYMWKPSAVSIGYFQDVHDVVNVDACRKHGVEIVRRPTGGGAVYHDEVGEVTYSVVVDESSLGVKNPIGAYEKICSGVIEALKIIGVNVDYNPGSEKACPNLVVNGKKLSGNAQLRRSGVILQHGTILVDVNLKSMFTFLRVPWTRNLNEILAVAEKKITSLKNELGYAISPKEVYKALKKGFSKAVNIDFFEKNLTEYELKLAEALYVKYRSRDWTFNRKVPSNLDICVI